MKRTRKQTLIEMLEDVGNYDGIKVYRSAGEDCAIQMVIELVRRTPHKVLDEIGKQVEQSIFWRKQW